MIDFYISKTIFLYNIKQIKKVADGRQCSKHLQTPRQVGTIEGIINIKGRDPSWYNKRDVR